MDTTLAHALTYRRWLLLVDHEEIAEAWRSAEERVLPLLDDYGLENVDSVGRTALQTIVFGLYRAVADELNPITRTSGRPPRDGASGIQ